ncbi:hypothetical protein [Corynebacterium gallinarum]|uniref:Uncharacterized protein n=1 Tax=Corynebacterium gallinarum TaxID=2762214 RepID=A0A8I0HGU2_9CORY|nr:hypothetical protein [Corynebacterium gallinarum]MBD8028735.1 hypothetical protein [Corynebacterium gallinarum]
MPDLAPYEQGSQMPRWPFVVIGLCCLVLVIWLKLPGLVLAGLIIALVYSIRQMRTHSPEISSLITSIQLSADEIRDVQEEWETFLNDPATDALADRTLHRPALADPDCADPDIQRFHFTLNSARRFIRRLEARLQGELTVPQLEGILQVTDARALDLRETWLAARRAAHHIGPNYGPDGDIES